MQSNRIIIFITFFGLSLLGAGIYLALISKEATVNLSKSTAVVDLDMPEGPALKESRDVWSLGLPIEEGPQVIGDRSKSSEVVYVSRFDADTVSGDFLDFFAKSGFEVKKNISDAQQIIVAKDADGKLMVATDYNKSLKRTTVTINILPQ